MLHYTNIPMQITGMVNLRVFTASGIVIFKSPSTSKESVLKRSQLQFVRNSIMAGKQGAACWRGEQKGGSNVYLTKMQLLCKVMITKSTHSSKARIYLESGL